MTFERAFAVGAIDEFKQRVVDNALRLASDTGDEELTFPAAIVLVLDRANGGNNIGEELVGRFNLIDLESRNVIDFFFLGWGRQSSSATQLTFDLASFESCIQSLRTAGVRDFGGYADLLLFDVWLRNGRVILDFENALQLDLADAVASKRIASVGAFVESLLRVMQDIQSEQHDTSTVLRVSLRLGLATARRSIVQYILDKWGKMVGANSLLTITPRRIAPAIDVAKI